MEYDDENEFDQFKNKKSYPSHPKKPEPPQFPKSPTVDKIKDYAKELNEYIPCLEDFSKELDKYNKEVIEYNNEEGNLIAKFWEYLFSQHGISQDHPKASLLRERAWDRGHANGLSEVANAFENLVEFIK